MTSAGASRSFGQPKPAWRGHVRFAVSLLLMPTVLFGTAGRVTWLFGWLFVCVTVALTVSVRVLSLRWHPDLIAERDNAITHAEAKQWDRLLVAVLGGLCPLALWIIAGLSQRFALPSGLPTLIQWLAIPVIVSSGALSAWAMLTNRFFSSLVRIQRDRGHTVVSTGPYAFVRHPGYAGMVLFNLGSPLVLGAVWAMIPALIVLAVLVLRTAMEDATLHRELDGYADYARRVRHRLVPGLW